MEVVFLATKNVHKFSEFQQILKGIFNLRPLPQGVPDAPETGTTFKENALQKAMFYLQFVSGWVLSDDSGLVVPALNGEPGVYSARYAGMHGNDKANNQKLLNKLEKVHAKDRSASFVCALALAGKQADEPIVVEGCIDGRITFQERGVNGFGYDSIFFVEELNQTFAESTTLEKNAYSHRAKALQLLIDAWEVRQHAYLSR